MDPLRILYVVNRMDVGGSQTHLLQVLRLLDRQSFAPALCCLTGAGELMDEVRSLGVPVFDAGMGAGLKSPSIAPALWRLVKLMRRGDYGVAHNYLLRANIVGAVAARAARVPVVLGSKRGCHERRGMELVGARIANRLSDCVTTNADAVREFVHLDESCPKQKMVVIPSGIDTDRFQPLTGDDYKQRLGLDPSRPVVGIVTRMRVRKGVEEFLNAMNLVRRSVPGVQTVVVGEVELAEELRSIVREGGMEADTHMLGRRSDMPEVFASFDVFVLSSHDEGMSNAILEAMAMEKPVVATDVGGTGEVVRHGASGLLVPARVVEPLAAAIGTVVGAADRGQEMGRCGREIVVNGFSSRSMVKQMEELYLALGRQHERLAPIVGQLQTTT